jgi:hypothetical protein
MGRKHEFDSCDRNILPKVPYGSRSGGVNQINMATNTSNNKNSRITVIFVTLTSAIGVILTSCMSGTNVDPSVSLESPSTASIVSQITQADTSTVSFSSIAGRYGITGNNPDGSSYTGTLNVTALSSAYQLIWTVGEKLHIGIGILEGNILVVGWGSRQCGIVSYQVQSNGNLDGKWASFAQDSTGLELAVPSSLDPNNEIVSQYTATGRNPSGSTYREKILVQDQGGLYKFLWADSRSTGTGIKSGNVVAVGFGSVPCNVVLYRVQEDGSLNGVWGLYGGSQPGEEQATRQ